MKVRWKYLLSIALWSLGLVFSLNSVQAQTKLGVVWNPDESQSSVSSQLASFSKYSTGLLIVEHPVAESTLSELDKSGIPYLVNSGFEFYTTSRFTENKARVLARIKTIYQKYSPSPTFLGLILFNSSQIFRENFQILEQSVIEESGLKDSLQFYNILNQELLLFNADSAVAQILPSESLEKSSIHNFVHAIARSDKYLLVSDYWLTEISSKFPSFPEAISNASNLGDAKIPLPALAESSEPFQWSIFLIILLWISLAINIMINATYKNTILRYFLAHRFFVDDVLSYRQRSSVSAIFLLIQHALFGGLVTYFLSKVYLSEIGLQSLFHFAPALAIVGQNYFSLFLFTAFIVLFIELIAILWIYIPNPNLVHFNQAMNIFTWIFHLDFVVVTVMGVLYISQASHYFLLALAIFYLIVWYASFNISAFDTSKRLSLERGNYLLKTIALHTLVSTLALVALFIYSYWIQVLDLAIRV